MNSSFYTNYSETKFIDKLKECIDTCDTFYFSVSFIKKAGLQLILPNIEAALARGSRGFLITSTYQNFTDIESLRSFKNLMNKYPESFKCHLDVYDKFDNGVGFHTKGYLFEFRDRNELLIGSSNITLYALLKNIEWDLSIIEDKNNLTFSEAKKEFYALWNRSLDLTDELIDEYKTKLYYSIERWDMDYDISNNEYKPNYMQKRALKELNRYRAIGVKRAMIVASAGSGKTFLAAFDALNFNPNRLLYIVKEGSILTKSAETFGIVFGSDKTIGLYNKDYKDFDADFVFSTNITMANNLEMFDKHEFDYIIVDECHHSVADSYKKIIEYFEPDFLLGLTATPERMDEEDVFALFDENVPYELRLRDAIINGLVVPFRYYGIRDDLIEYGLAETKSHKFIEQFSDEKHVDFIRQEIEKYRKPNEKLKALAFCKDVSHAIRMSQAMEDYYGTRYLTGKNSTGERVKAYRDLQNDNDSLEILFTVDILNEGVDIPGVNMVLFLRPTDSQTVFIQQLGRGLRKFEGKEDVVILDFIGNEYRRSVQIAMALANLSENFVIEKSLIESLIKDNFEPLGLKEYGVEINIDELSKKEILGYLDNANFNTKQYLEQDYKNFKKYIGSVDYPSHMDYLNNDYAPDLIRFMQSKLDGKKNRSYYKFLTRINETNLPVFNDRQISFIDYLSEMLPIVRPYEYLIVSKLIKKAGMCSIEELKDYCINNTKVFNEDQYNHAIKYMIKTDFFDKSDNYFSFRDVQLGVEIEAYLNDLLEYGLSKFDIDYDLEGNDVFKKWGKYKKTQIKQLLLQDPEYKQKGTDYGDVTYAYVTVIKSDSIKDNQKYADGYIDERTFQWECESNISENNLQKLKDCSCIHLFVRKTESEQGVVLPFTYIGKGTMNFIENSKKANGAYLFRVVMEDFAPEDIYYDFKLPN